MKVVADNTRHNGIPIAMAAFESPGAVDSVLRFYRKIWASNENSIFNSNEHIPPFVESTYPGWVYISRLHNGYSVVVQLNTGQGTKPATGFVSVIALNSRAIGIDHGVFNDLDTLSSNRSVDGIDTSSLRVYGSTSPATRTRDLYRDRLLRRGWQLIADSPVETGWVTQLGRDSARLALTFMESREYASVVVVHEMTSD